MFAKCKEAERRVKFKENRKRYREETEKYNQFPLGKYQRESCSANFIQKQASRNWIQNRRMSSQITFYTSTRIFVQNFRLKMVAAIDWCSHTTHDWIWLVSCFGFNGLLRQYYSLYRAVSQRVRKKREKIDERKKISKQPPPAPTASAIDPCPLWNNKQFGFTLVSRRFNKTTLWHIWHKLEKQIKKKSERKKSERREKRREASYCFSLLTEDELSYEHRCKVMTK